MHHQIPDRIHAQESINKKKRTCHLVDFAVSAYHIVKKKKEIKKEKYFDLAWEP